MALIILLLIYTPNIALHLIGKKHGATNNCIKVGVFGFYKSY